jgi:hypothetical protein
MSVFVVQAHQLHGHRTMLDLAAALGSRPVGVDRMESLGFNLNELGEPQ